jgi:hypothetical protein
VVRFGPIGAVADEDGVHRLRAQCDELRCHLGLLPVEVDGFVIGEIDLTPTKLTSDAFASLRADLERRWLGLISDPYGPTSVTAPGPDPVAIWRLVGPLLESLRRDPPEHLRPEPGPMRFERIRRPGQLTSSMVMARHRGGTGVAPRLAREISHVELAPVVDALERLESVARRHPRGAALVPEIRRWRTMRPFSDVASDGRSRVRHIAATDRRLRQVIAVTRELRRPDAAVTEGPGDLRLGIKPMDRLYEYWVFLRILESAIERFGAPVSDLRQLAHDVGQNRKRLDLPMGTTVEFTNGVCVVFEPRISTSATHSWRGLELALHPDRARAQYDVTPDVLVFEPAQDEGPPRCWVVDAKYRARHALDAAAVDAHSKYSRLRFGGDGVVHSVLVAHPHEGYEFQFAGYGAVDFAPGRALSELPWTAPPIGRPAALQAAPNADHTTSELTSSDQVSDVPPTEVYDNDEIPVASESDSEDDDQFDTELPATVTVVADQWWMHQMLGRNRRIDLDDLARVATMGRPARLIIPVPSSPLLQAFSAAVERRGWEVVETSLDRKDQLAAASALASELTGAVILVTGDPAFLECFEDHQLDIWQFTELDRIETLGG